MRRHTPPGQYARFGEDEGAAADGHDTTNSLPAPSDPGGRARVELRFAEVHSAGNHERSAGSANLIPAAHSEAHAGRRVRVGDRANEADAVGRALPSAAGALARSREDVGWAGEIEELGPRKNQESDVLGHALEYGAKYGIFVVYAASFECDLLGRRKTWPS